MNIRKKGDPILSQVCEPVDENEVVDKLIKEMWEVMYAHRGFGLSAPQVGVAKRIFVINVDGFRQVFINPKIIRLWGGTKICKEGCLSFPDLFVPKIRNRKIEIEWLSHRRKPKSMNLKDLVARVIQHEMDHLDGKTIDD